MLKLIKFVGITSLIIGAFLDSIKNGFMAAGIILLIDYMIVFAGSIKDDDDIPTKTRPAPVVAHRRNRDRGAPTKPIKK